jgi:hypothetical protein
MLKFKIYFSKKINFRFTFTIECTSRNFDMQIKQKWVRVLDYELWPCPMGCNVIVVTVCPHPHGYHEWMAANPWASTLQMPRKQTPEEDTQSEIDMDFDEAE